MSDDTPTDLPSAPPATLPTHLLPTYSIAEAEGGSPDKTAFLLHGILGSGQNWRTFARRLTDELPDWRIVLADLRCHGRSGCADPPHTLEAAAGDLVVLAEHLGARPEMVIGHSFGGKVALTYARDHRDGLRQLWVLDSVPGAGEPTPEELIRHDVLRVIADLRAIELPLPSRRALVDQLGARGYSPTLAQWMTTNLRPADDGGYRWRFDLDAVQELLASYFRTDFWPFLQEPPAGIEIHVVRAELSRAWDGGDIRRLETLGPGAHAHLLASSGHWVHVDNPEGLIWLMKNALETACDGG